MQDNGVQAVQDAVPAATVAKINAHYEQAEAAKTTAITQAQACGALLCEAKSLCGHGNWSEWLRRNFKGSERTAQVYLRIARGWSQLAKSAASADLSIAQALELLAEPVVVAAVR